jgi:hypothetical protein
VSGLVALKSRSVDIVVLGAGGIEGFACPGDTDSLPDPAAVGPGCFVLLSELCHILPDRVALEFSFQGNGFAAVGKNRLTG